MAKLKFKTKRAVAKRVKKTASGKFSRPSAGRGHLLSSKNRKRKRQLRAGGLISAADQKRIARVFHG